jgi:hypothetical protein
MCISVMCVGSAFLTGSLKKVMDVAPDSNPKGTTKRQHNTKKAHWLKIVLG